MVKFPGENAGILTESERAERKEEEDKTQAKLEEPRSGFAECFGKWHLNVGPEGKKPPAGVCSRGALPFVRNLVALSIPFPPFPHVWRYGGEGWARKEALTKACPGDAGRAFPVLAKSRWRLRCAAGSPVHCCGGTDLFPFASCSLASFALAS